MTQQRVQVKTYVRGAFLYSEDGLNYQEKHRDTSQKTYEDRMGLLNIHKEVQQKKKNIQNKRKFGHNNENKLVQKPVLIPIRDTPVEPVPQPILDNQKCERATQEQFDYFQTYISQKEKQRQFEQQQERQIEEFLQKQEKKKQEEEEVPPPTVNLVMERQPELLKKPKLSKLKIKIIKKQNPTKNIKKRASNEFEDAQELQKISKVRNL